MPVLRQTAHGEFYMLPDSELRRRALRHGGLVLFCIWSIMVMPVVVLYGLGDTGLALRPIPSLDFTISRFTFTMSIGIMSVCIALYFALEGYYREQSHFLRCKVCEQVRDYRDVCKRHDTKYCWSCLCETPHA